MGRKPARGVLGCHSHVRGTCVQCNFFLAIVLVSVLGSLRHAAVTWRVINRSTNNRPHPTRATATAWVTKQVK